MALYWITDSICSVLFFFFMLFCIVSIIIYLYIVLAVYAHTWWVRHLLSHPAAPRGNLLSQSRRNCLKHSFDTSSLDGKTEINLSPKSSIITSFSTKWLSWLLEISRYTTRVAVKPFIYLRLVFCRDDERDQLYVISCKGSIKTSITKSKVG